MFKLNELSVNSKFFEKGKGKPEVGSLFKSFRENEGFNPHNPSYCGNVKLKFCAFKGTQLVF